MYARTFRLTTDAALSGTVAIEVSGAKNYAGRAMDWTFREDREVTAELRSLTAEPGITVRCGEKAVVRVQAQPAAAAAGRQVAVRLDNPYVAEPVEAYLTLDDTGAAELELTAVLPGSVGIAFCVEGTGLAAKTALSVTLPGESGPEDTPPYAAYLLSNGRGADAAALLQRLVGLPGDWDK